MFVFERTQELPISVARAWEFFSSPKNLQVITPSYLDFQIKTKFPEKMYEGLFIGYTVKPLFGIPIEWVTEITHVKENVFFVDEQRKGPYTIWHHEHHFEEIEGGVRMLDRVSYQIPLGFLGEMVHPILVEPKLKEIFNYRWNKVEELFGKFK